MPATEHPCQAQYVRNSSRHREGDICGACGVAELTFGNIKLFVCSRHVTLCARDLKARSCTPQFRSIQEDKETK